MIEDVEDHLVVEKVKVPAPDKTTEVGRLPGLWFVQIPGIVEIRWVCSGVWFM